MQGKQLLTTTISAGTAGAAITYLALFLASFICKDCSLEGKEALAAAIACLISAIIRFIRAKWNVKIPT